MTKKILTSLDLRGDILIGGTANSTSGYVLTSNGAGAISWAAQGFSRLTSFSYNSSGGTTAGYSGVKSTTSQTISTGSKTFSVSSTGAFLVNDRVRIVYSGDGLFNKWMEGNITALTTNSSITVSIDKISSATGTFAAWTIGIFGITGSAVIETSTGNAYGIPLTITPGPSIGSINIVNSQASGGHLILKGGYAEGSNALPGNVYIEANDFAYDNIDGGWNTGKVVIASANTDTVYIGTTDYSYASSITSNPGATTVNIMEKSSTSYTKVLNLANNGGTTNINIGISSTSPTVKIATSASTAGVIQIGTNATLSSTFNFGKNFVWQPVTGTTSPSAPTSFSTTQLLTAAHLLTFIIQYTGASAGTFTLPTGTLMDSNVQNSFTAMGFDWSIIATAAGAVTVSGGTGHTYVGGTTVSAGTSARFRSTRSTTTVWVTFRIS